MLIQSKSATSTVAAVPSPRKSRRRRRLRIPREAVMLPYSCRQCWRRISSRAAFSSAPREPLARPPPPRWPRRRFSLTLYHVRPPKLVTAEAPATAEETPFQRRPPRMPSLRDNAGRFRPARAHISVRRPGHIEDTSTPSAFREVDDVISLRHITGPPISEAIHFFL